MAEEKSVPLIVIPVSVLAMPACSWTCSVTGNPGCWLVPFTAETATLEEDAAVTVT
jgi:hypothetical protein